MPNIGAREILRRDKFLARRHEIGALVGGVPDVGVADQLEIAIPALAEIVHIFAAMQFHPGDETFAIAHFGPEVRRERSRYVRERGSREIDGGRRRGGSEEKAASVHRSVSRALGRQKYCSGIAGRARGAWRIATSANH